MPEIGLFGLGGGASLTDVPTSSFGVNPVRLGRQQGSIGVPPVGASNRGQVKCLPSMRAPGGVRHRQKNSRDAIPP